jgi:phytoene/squalene synthetase
VYLPQEDVRRFRCTEEELFAGSYTERFRQLMEFQVQRTEGLFRNGKPLLTEVGKDLALELRLTWNGGMKILQKVSALDYNVLRQRPVLTGLDKLSVLFSSFLQR